LEVGRDIAGSVRELTKTLDDKLDGITKELRHLNHSTVSLRCAFEDRFQDVDVSETEGSESDVESPSRWVRELMELKEEKQVWERGASDAEMLQYLKRRDGKSPFGSV